MSDLYLLTFNLPSVIVRFCRERADEVLGVWHRGFPSLVHQLGQFSRFVRTSHNIPPTTPRKKKEKRKNIGCESVMEGVEEVVL